MFAGCFLASFSPGRLSKFRLPIESQITPRAQVGWEMRSFSRIGSFTNQHLESRISRDGKRKCEVDLRGVKLSPARRSGTVEG